MAHERPSTFCKLNSDSAHHCRFGCSSASWAAGRLCCLLLLKHSCANGLSAQSTLQDGVC